MDEPSKRFLPHAFAVRRIAMTNLRDLADCQSLRYHLKRAGTFVLYSIGEDGVDR
jgi:hypothetical protein